MIIYEVNIQVDNIIAGAFEQWLKPHIEEMLQFDGFVRAQLTEVEPDGSQPEEEAKKKHWSVQYYVENRSLLEDYFTHHAQRMRQQGLQKFKDHFSAKRRILSIHKTFEK